MTEKDLRKLKRADLLRLLVEQSRQLETQKADSAAQLEQLQQENEALKQKLADRQVSYENAGSLADSVMQVNGVMAAAQQAADLYLENIRSRSANQEAELNARDAACTKKCNEMLAAAEEECQRKRTETDAQCDAALSEASRKIYGYWDDVSGRLKAMVQAQASLQLLLGEKGVQTMTSQTKMEEVLFRSSDGKKA